MSYYEQINPPTHRASLINEQVPMSSCYFCNETMDSRDLSKHVTHCGAVLEECPENCGAYVSRNVLQEHRSQCFRGLNSKVDRTGSSIDDRIRSLRESAWKNKVVSILTLLRTAVHEGEQEIKELRDTLASSLQLTNEALRKDILEELYDNRRTVGSLNVRLGCLEKTCIELQQRAAQNFQQTAAQIDRMRFEAVDEQHRATEEREKCYAVLEEMRANFTAESATICRLWQEQVQNIHDMKLELEMRCKLSKELVDKYNVLFDKVEILETKVHRHSEALAQQTQNWKELKFQMKENVKYVEDILKDVSSKMIKNNSNQCNCGGEPVSIGKFIWRIDQFEEKLKDAKINDTVLCSPIFYNKEYGYTLRMELYPNGLGKWKNRHVIGCLRIVDGKWDPLLDWPCILKADVTLKDQTNPTNDLLKHVKSVKRGKAHEDLERNSDLYMFIPHSALDRNPGYTAGDVMFLDIRAKDQKLTGSTVSLV